MENIDDLLNKIDIDDFIWLINFFIVIFALLSNSYERNYILNKDNISKNKFKTINIGILIVALIIYCYYANNRYQDTKQLKNMLTNKNFIVTELNFIASILIVIATIIYLFTEIIDNNINEEGIDIF